jgi:RNA polymerase sigma-70 factor (ECF subfamily)
MATGGPRSRAHLRAVSSPPPEPAPRAPSDAALVVAARAGEDWAREALCRRYAAMVIGLSHRLLGRDGEADDLAQEAFAQALGSLDKLADPQAFAGWMKSIVVRTAHKLVRRRVLVRRLGLGPRGADAIDEERLVSPDAPPDVRAELRAVYALVESLPARQRIALVLRRVEGFSHEEVAEHLDVSLSTAKRLAASSDAALERAFARGSREGGTP